MESSDRKGYNKQQNLWVLQGFKRSLDGRKGSYWIPLAPYNAGWLQFEVSMFESDEVSVNGISF